MKSLRESLAAEKEQKAKLEKVRHLVDLLWTYVVKLKIKIVTAPRNKTQISLVLIDMQHLYKCKISEKLSFQKICRFSPVHVYLLFVVTCKNEFKIRY